MYPAPRLRGGYVWQPAPWAPGSQPTPTPPLWVLSDSIIRLLVRLSLLEPKTSPFNSIYIGQVVTNWSARAWLDLMARWMERLGRLSNWLMIRISVYWLIDSIDLLGWVRRNDRITKHTVAYASLFWMQIRTDP